MKCKCHPYKRTITFIELFGERNQTNCSSSNVRPREPTRQTHGKQQPDQLHLSIQKHYYKYYLPFHTNRVENLSRERKKSVGLNDLPVLSFLQR